MIIQAKTLEKLRNLIIDGTEYRTGPQLIIFFREFGFNFEYGPGFPSRSKFVDHCLSEINGKPELDKCIKKLFAPVNFIGRVSELDHIINEFNQYLSYDKWKIVRKNEEISFVKLDHVEIVEDPQPLNESDFLRKDFKEISLDSIGLDAVITEILKYRIIEIEKCLSIEAPLSAIFLAGSTLEGVLLGIALKYPKEFNLSASSPKDKDGKVKHFPEWGLSNFIDVSYEIGFLGEDVKKYSHVLREFRNYIHPFQQMSSRFNPDIHTARISWQVLKAALFQLSTK